MSTRKSNTRTKYERRAAALLTDFAIFHAALVITGRIDGWRGGKPMGLAALRARELLGEMGFPKGIPTPSRKARR